MTTKEAADNKFTCDLWVPRNTLSYSLLKDLQSIEQMFGSSSKWSFPSSDIKCQLNFADFADFSNVAESIRAVLLNFHPFILRPYSIQVSRDGKNAQAAIIYTISLSRQEINDDVSISK